MSTTHHPTRADTKAKPPVTPDVEAIVRDRLKTFERDKQDAADWADVKKRVLHQKTRP